MRLRILTEDDASLTSTVATGGFCNVLEGANYAPSFSDRADHLRSSNPSLKVDAGCTTAAWNPVAAVGISYTVGSLDGVGGNPISAPEVFPTMDVTSADGTTTPKATC